MLLMVIFIILLVGGIIYMIYKFLKGTTFFLAQVISTIIDNITFASKAAPMLKNETYKQRQAEKRHAEAMESHNLKLAIQQKQTELTTYATNKVAALRVKYPYADDSLFNQYAQMVSYASIPELQEVEELIKFNNKKNLNDTPLNNAQITTLPLTLKDLESLTPTETYVEHPLVMQIYQVKHNYYALCLRDAVTNDVKLLDSSSYKFIADARDKILSKQAELRNQKLQTTSADVRTMFMPNEILKDN